LIGHKHDLVSPSTPVASIGWSRIDALDGREWLNANDQPMRPVAYKCANPIKNIQTVPNIQSIVEMKRL